MAVRHIVQPGDCLARIARRYGVRDWRVIWDASDNDELRRRRPDPNILHTGDVVVVPDPSSPKNVSCETGRAHAFAANVPTRRVRLALQGGDGKPMASAQYRLVIRGKETVGSTDQDGVLDADVPADITEAELHLGPVVRQLAIGHLNPLRDTVDQGVTGVQARLANLGYAPGPVDGECGPRTRAAIRSFQDARGLAATGEVDDALLAELELVHGC